MKRSRIVLAILLLALLLPLTSADMGPRDAQRFNLIYETSEPVTLIDCQLIKCEDEECHNRELLNPDRYECFECAQKECRLEYVHSRHNMLIINFSDRERQSNVFKLNEYSTEFDVRVTDSELIVGDAMPLAIATFTKLPGAISLLMTTILELIAALIFIAVMDKPMRILLAVLIGNLISFPSLMQLVNHIGGSDTIIFIILVFEVFVVLFEGFVMYLFAKKTMSIPQSLGLSLLMNSTSFLIGMVLPIGRVSLGPLFRIVLSLLIVLFISLLLYNYLKERASIRPLRTLVISFMVLCCVVSAGLVSSCIIDRGRGVMVHELGCEPEYYANMTGEELQDFPALAVAIDKGKIIPTSFDECKKLRDLIKRRAGYSTADEYCIRVEGEYYEVRTI